MTVTTHEVGFDSLDALSDVDSLCVFVGEDERPLRGVAGYLDWRLCGKLSRMLKDGFFTGRADDKLLFTAAGRVAAPRVFAVGLGQRKGLSPERLAKALGEAAQMLNKAGAAAVALEVPGADGVEDAARAEALVKHFLSAFKGSRVAVLTERSVGRLIPAAHPVP